MDVAELDRVGACEHLPLLRRHLWHFAGDFFGLKNTGAIYGLMLIGWSLGGIVGLIMASALIGEDKAYTVAYTTSESSP